MTGDLKMGQNRIKELPKLRQTDYEAISKDYLISQLNTLTHVYLDRHGTLPVLKDLNMGSNKITNVDIVNLSGTNAPNKYYVDKLVHLSQVKPSHQKDVFSYLMSNVLEWTDLTDGGNKISNLSSFKGNFHSYNNKVINLHNNHKKRSRWL